MPRAPQRVAAFVAVACTALLASLALSGCAAEPLEFADWTLPVPEGMPIIEYAAVSDEQRSGRIELIEDLVLGRDADDPNQRFYGARDIAIDADGGLFVLDANNRRVQVFDPDGSFVRSFGREGQGPGEFEAPGSLGIVGDRLVARAARTRLSIFDLDGNHVEDLTFEGIPRPLNFITGLSDGTFLANRTGSPIIRGQPLVAGWHTIPFTIAKFSLDGDELATHAEVETLSIVGTSGSEKQAAGIPSPFASFGVAPSGHVYVTTSEQYQLLAVDPDAEPAWALRVAYVPEPIGQEHIDRAIESARRRRPETTYGDLLWRESLPALSHIAVDGHGHIYVYPYFARPEGDTIVDRPVDVYAPDGERLFAGFIADRRWRRAWGDFVFAAGADRVTGETLVWRWRLDEPF